MTSQNENPDVFNVLTLVYCKVEEVKEINDGTLIPGEFTDGMDTLLIINQKEIVKKQSSHSMTDCLVSVTADDRKKKIKKAPVEVFSTDDSSPS